MKEPRVRVWIDARKEGYRPGRLEELVYTIPHIRDPRVWEKVYQTLGALVKEIEVLVPDTGRVKIVYDPARISPSFIDYLLQQKGIAFSRPGP
ncbi:hypothetical protein [Thermanaeromonas sp. C210]|uniref:hypothetical protein n=1 Tax=Thermanaeromonas sp. C210 TaxID=2731925 RepID=UPI00155B61C7|nr:hypothetical protein [Thermanaeromonas sp. C210]GFN22322.1 hypothetical protein TAMC210_06380 [Thermanaeromonas sp. C210]